MPSNDGVLNQSKSFKFWKFKIFSNFPFLIY